MFLLKTQTIYKLLCLRHWTLYIRIGQSFTEVHLGDIKNCLTKVVKVKSLKSITRRQNICHEIFLHVSCCVYQLFWLGRKKKLLQITIPLRKWIQLKVYSHLVTNVWISSLTLILIFWWIEQVILISHRKVSQNFAFNFRDIWKRKFVLYQT